MRELLFIHRLVLHDCLLFGVIAVAIAMLLSTTYAAAQDTPEEQETERDRPVRMGVYFSWPGLTDNFDLSRAAYGGGNIESPEDDVMPYPAIFLSLRYGKKYQSLIGWAKDRYSNSHEHNETMARIIARYNYYPSGKNLYAFGGVSAWYFNKKFSFSKSVCTDDLILEGENFICDGENRTIDIKTDRPKGRSIILGVITGLGVEYSVSNTTIMSHEIEIYLSPCSYEKLCSGFDIKILGLYRKF